MTLTEVAERIDAILAVTRDYEKAHEMEDGLLWEFVAFASTSCDPGIACAAKELLTRLSDADFPRYCA